MKIIYSDKLGAGIVGLLFGMCFGIGVVFQRYQPWAAMWGVSMLVSGMVFIYVESRHPEFILPESPEIAGESQ
jgi:hypothetical protein